LERLKRVRASYREAFQNDDVAAMINERAAVLQGLQQARARKQLLTQQSAQLGQYEHALADFVTAIDSEGLTRFEASTGSDSIGEFHRERARLDQTAPGERGDISAKLETFATRMREIESTICSARSKKPQAEQPRSRRDRKRFFKR
jgi:soluble cytochrome b562